MYRKGNSGKEKRTWEQDHVQVGVNQGTKESSIKFLSGLINSTFKIRWRKKGSEKAARGNQAELVNTHIILLVYSC